MKTKIIISAIFLAMFATNALAQNANEILKNADNVLNAAKDMESVNQMTIIGKSGTKSVRTMQVFQKGSEKRLVKFLSPADQKGIAFLSLPNNNQMLYLPAFNKIRRIASHVKNTRFAGTDFSYEDLEAKRYSDSWNAELKTKNDNEYILTLTQKDKVESEYSKMEISVRAKDYFPYKVVYFDKKGNSIKQMTVNETIVQNGVLTAKEYEMKDLKAGSLTKITLQKVEINKGLSDDLFTERNMTK